MKYKKMCEMSEEEIEYILKEVCGLEYNKLDSIEYDKDNNSIDVTVLETWTTEDENNVLVNFEDTENITLSDDNIEFEHGQMTGSKHKYLQYLLAKGYYYLFEYNEYLE